MAIDFRQIKFFVEGDGDKVFIRDILRLWYNAEFTKEQLKELIIICKGFNQIASQVDEFKQVEAGKKREGGKNIVIFDADYSGREKFHGFKDKVAYLEQAKFDLKISFDIFLFPNNADDGTLETLLESCINPKHTGIMDCWNGFEECVSTKGNYTIPANKSKMYVYLECLHGQSNSEKEKIKDPNRDFTQVDKWVIEDKQNPYLVELKTFLDKQMQQYNR